MTRYDDDSSLRPVIDVIDREIMRSVVGDDPELIQELAAAFLPGAQAGVAEIVAAFDGGAAEAVRATSHKLKGACALVGARHLIALCIELEGAAKVCDWRLMGELTGRLALRLTDVEGEIKAFLEEIGEA